MGVARVTQTQHGNFLLVKKIKEKTEKGIHLALIVQILPSVMKCSTQIDVYCKLMELQAGVTKVYFEI